MKSNLIYAVLLLLVTPAISYAQSESPVGCYELAVQIPGTAGLVNINLPAPPSPTIALGSTICTKESHVTPVTQADYDAEASGQFDIVITSDSGKPLSQYSFALKAVITAAGRANTIYAQTQNDLKGLDQLQPDSFANGVAFVIYNNIFKPGDMVGAMVVNGQTFLLLQK